MTDDNEIEKCEFLYVHEDAVREVLTKMPKEDMLYDLAELFKVFGDSTRIRILYALFERELCVCDIAGILGLTQTAVSPPKNSSRRRGSIWTSRNTRWTRTDCCRTAPRKTAALH